MKTLVDGPTVTVTGTLTAGSPSVTVLAVASITGAVSVSGLGIPPGCYVKWIDDATTLTLTLPATIDGPSMLTFGIEPVTLQEARDHMKSCGVMFDDHSVLASFIAAARILCETECWRTFITSTWDLSLPGFPYGHRGHSGWYNPHSTWPYPHSRSSDAIHIPNPPLQAVISVAYLGSDGVPAIVPEGGYGVQEGTPGLVYMLDHASWPQTRGEPSSVVVRYVAGYGLADAVYASTKIAILMAVSFLYEHRGDTEGSIPMVVKALLSREMWGGVT